VFIFNVHYTGALVHTKTTKCVSLEIEYYCFNKEIILKCFETSLVISTLKIFDSFTTKVCNTSSRLLTEVKTTPYLKFILLRVYQI